MLMRQTFIAVLEVQVRALNLHPDTTINAVLVGMYASMCDWVDAGLGS